MTTPDQRLLDALRESLSPQAVALIAAKCRPGYAQGEAGQRAEREVAWFTDQLIQLLGPGAYDQLCKELGV
ncbi:MAG: hypothetical protein AAF328_08510 [Planctomycetota bacterium]